MENGVTRRAVLAGGASLLSAGCLDRYQEVRDEDTTEPSQPDPTNPTTQTAPLDNSRTRTIDGYEAVDIDRVVDAGLEPYTGESVYIEGSLEKTGAKDIVYRIPPEPGETPNPQHTDDVFYNTHPMFYALAPSRSAAATVDVAVAESDTVPWDEDIPPGEEVPQSVGLTGIVREYADDRDTGYMLEYDNAVFTD